MPLHSSVLEMSNNKIKVIKRKAYGFYDIRYLLLKIFKLSPTNRMMILSSLQWS